MASILKLIVISACLSGASLSAKNLGIHGHIYPIEEENLLHVLSRKVSALSEEEVFLIQNKVKDHIVSSFKEPYPVEDIRETVKPRIFYFDPTICVQQTIYDHEGHVIVKKGTSINPLENLLLTQDLIFFDATNPLHIEWAKKQPAAKWILIKGRPLDLEEAEKRPIYFDQFGILTKKLKIHQVPAKVSQEGLKLRIEEILIKGKGCLKT